MSDVDVLIELRGQTLWVTLNRESRRNAISHQMILGIQYALDENRTNDAVRSICITGAGDKVFCSGADLMGALAGASPLDAARAYANLLGTMTSYSKPIVARVNGHCMAGGIGLMLASDIVYAKDSITVGTPEVKVGLFPMMIGALIFRNGVRKQALEMMYTGNTLNAEEARAMGLITRTCSGQLLDSAVEETLARINANAPLAIRIGKPALAEAEKMPLEDGLMYLCEKLGDVLRTEDAAEGMTAFLQKRTPEWKTR
jgi:enoyl-CoA hydratase/carnithine racemase